MQKIEFELSEWFIPLCLIAAAAVAFLLYTRSSPWGQTTNKILAGIRFVLFSLLAILLLNPLINKIISYIEDPVYVIAVDNSQSIENHLGSNEISQVSTILEDLRTGLVERNNDVQIRALSGELVRTDSISFDENFTDLNGFLREIQSDFENKNLAGVYLVSDGSYNQGVSPTYFPYKIPVHAIAVGDTTQKSDVFIKNIMFNKIAYQGNKFPVVTEVVNYGFEGEKSKVKVYRGGQEVGSSEVTFNSNEGLNRVEVEIEAVDKGLQALRVYVEPPGNEKVTANNARNIFVDVVEGKQNILLIAYAPHPDVKAISAVIDNNQNYELDILIPGINVLDPKKKYDLVIAHNGFDRFNRMQKHIDDARAKGIPIFHILGSRTSVPRVKKSNPEFGFVQNGGQRDNVLAAINTEFRLFTIPESSQEVFRLFPPVIVPFGDFRLDPQAEVILYQKVGSITTAKPLLYTTRENDQKVAYLMGEGIWKWRLQEYALNESSKSFDQLFLKLIQYMSTQDDKRKFKFFPEKSEYYENQSISFQAEVYNDIYERVFGTEIDVKISNSSGVSTSYTFSPVSPYSKLEVSDFGPGIYSYQASINLNGGAEIVNGKFSVRELQLEELDQVAQHDILRQVSSSSGGMFYNMEDQSQMMADLDKLQSKGVVHSDEDTVSIINLKWIIALAIALASIEWFTRKYSGGY